MIIDVYGDALRLLEHFVYYATGEHSHRVADAMGYNPDGFLHRARLLKEAYDAALDGHRPQACGSNCFAMPTNGQQMGRASYD